MSNVISAFAILMIAFLIPFSYNYPCTRPITTYGNLYSPVCKTSSKYEKRRRKLN